MANQGRCCDKKIENQRKTPAPGDWLGPTSKRLPFAPSGGGSQSGGEMRRCVLCGRWVLLAFQVEVGGFVCEAARLGLGGGGKANEAVRLVWRLGPAGFPEGSGEKRH